MDKGYITLEWIKKNIKVLSVRKIVDIWLSLLEKDERFFSSKDFRREMKEVLGGNMYFDVVSRLPYNFSNKNKSNRQNEKLLQRIDKLHKYREFNKKYLPLNEINFEGASNESCQKGQADKSRKTVSIKDDSTASSNNKSETINNSHTNSRIIASNVQASEFIIQKGYIAYKDYYLRSKRITCFGPPSILSKITHTFTLVKDKSIVTSGKKNKVEKRFFFDPCNDLSFILAEIERHHSDSTPINDRYPLEGTFDLPWDYVNFYDGIMYLAHPNSSKRATCNPFHFRHSDILKSYRDILPYIKERCPKFRVRAIDGRIEEVLNFTDFKKHIKHFHDYSTAEVEEIPGFSINSKRYEYSVEYFSKSSIVKKSPFLNYLCTQQIKDQNIYAVTESAVHDSSYLDKDESGYLFTIRQMHGVSTILFENASDSSRSSIVFKVSTDRYEEAIREIKDFLASDIKNKRQKLTYGKINFKNPAILSYGRVMHRDYYSWVEYLLDFL